VPRTLYQLEGQQLRLLDSKVNAARAHLIHIAREAGDVPEWNAGGHGYEALMLLESARELIDAYLTSSQTLQDEDD
jgi:hypothetical protein